MAMMKKRLRFYEAYREIMADDIRLRAYCGAKFESVKKGDVVLDLGSGLGILAFFVTQAGADRVYAVEESDVISFAEELASINGYDMVTFIMGKSTEVDLPEKVDLVITKTFGSFGWVASLAFMAFSTAPLNVTKSPVLLPSALLSPPHQCP
jgi:protein arginine N-methyltransferase 1